MAKLKSPPGALSTKAALAIINSAANPAVRHETTNVTAQLLAEIIERETNVTALLHALNCYVDAQNAGQIRAAQRKAHAAIRKVMPEYYKQNHE